VLIKDVSWYLISSTFIFTALILNTFTVWDLYILLRNPFTNATKKAGRYLWLALAISSVLATASFFFTNQETRGTLGTSDYLYLGITGFNIVFAVVALPFVYNRLK